MYLDAVTALEEWLQFPLNYSDGVVILSGLTTSPSYEHYVQRVADAALRSPHEVSNDVNQFLAKHPKGRQVRNEVAPMSALAQPAPMSALAQPAPMSALAQPAPSALRTRCIYCGHIGIYQKKTSRLTGNGWVVFLLLLFFFFPLAFIPFFFMREKHYSDYCRRCNRLQDID